MLREERFGPAVVLARWQDPETLLAALQALDGQLSASLHTQRSDANDAALLERVLTVLADRVGRVVFDGFPTWVAVTWAMQHGGPCPAATAPSTTSVGRTAARRFLRPVCWQNAPASVLPPALQDTNPLALWRRKWRADPRPAPVNEQVRETQNPGRH